MSMSEKMNEYLLISQLPEFYVLCSINYDEKFPLRELPKVIEKLQSSKYGSDPFNIFNLHDRFTVEKAIKLGSMRGWYYREGDFLVPTVAGKKLEKTVSALISLYILPSGGGNFFDAQTVNKRLKMLEGDFKEKTFMSWTFFETDFSGKDLSGSDFTNSHLFSVNFKNSNLSGCNFNSATLINCNFQGSNIHEANLLGIKACFFDLLNNYHDVYHRLLSALRLGKIDWSNLNGDAAPCSLLRFVQSSMSCYDLDLLFLMDKYLLVDRFADISAGDTPSTNPIAKIFEDWILEFEKTEVWN